MSINRKTIHSHQEKDSGRWEDNSRLLDIRD